MSSELGEPMFCLKDVCEVLELRTQKVVQRLNDDVLSKYPIVDVLGRTQQATFVNEDMKKHPQKDGSDSRLVN